MRVSVLANDDVVQFSVFSDTADRKRNPRFGESRHFSFKTSGHSSFGHIHPDRLALVAILNTLPFCSEELQIDWPISRRFLEATKIISRIKITSKEGETEPVERETSGRYALSFSGGADSTAALAVMPQSTESVFMLRSKSGRKSLYDSDAALESCRKLRTLGFTVHIVESDFEYLRDPIGFPTDLSVATPAILMSGFRNFESIAFGTILESAYGTSGSKFRNYTDSSHFRLWSTLFNSVGLGYSLPVAGVSEVGSAILCRDTPIGRFHQSCIRGKWGDPCNKCWKCFRKNALIAALEGKAVPEDFENVIRRSKEVKKHLVENKPIKHEGVLSYSLERSSGGGEVTQSLRDLTRVGIIETVWMENWYPESNTLIDPGYSDFTIERLSSILGEMDEEKITHLQEWNNPSDEDREKRLEKFSALL